MRAAFFTLGCKVNQYETSVLMRQFAEQGFELVPPNAQAEVYVVNSCTVTAEGDRKSRQMLRRFRRQNPRAVVALCGCFPQAFPKEAEAIPEADVIVGTKGRAQLLRLVLDKLAGAERMVDILPHTPGEIFEPMQAKAFANHTRAFLKIQDGCERYCAYCIIPAARGAVRSKPLQDIRAELMGYANAGYREVVLVGINLSCYGLDLGLRLWDAVALACGIPGIGRVRLGSLEPELLTPADIQAMAQLPKLCPQFHLSLQSGCNETLCRMNRPYTAAEYRKIVNDLRAAFPHVAITTDIMVGFPGESEEEFSQSLAFAREIGFAKAHVFAYSKRPGTAAAGMGGQVAEEIKAVRAKQMAGTAEEGQTAFLQSQVGREVCVLFEAQTIPGIWEGYSENYTHVRIKSEQNLYGKIERVRLNGLLRESCTGELV